MKYAELKAQAAELRTRLEALKVRREALEFKLTLPELDERFKKEAADCLVFMLGPEQTQIAILHEPPRLYDDAGNDVTPPRPDMREVAAKLYELTGTPTFLLPTGARLEAYELTRPETTEVASGQGC